MASNGTGLAALVRARRPSLLRGLVVGAVLVLIVLAAMAAGRMTTRPEDARLDIGSANFFRAIHGSTHQVLAFVAVGAKVHPDVQLTVVGSQILGDAKMTFFNNGTCSGSGQVSATAELVNGGVHATSFTYTPLSVGNISLLVTFLPEFGVGGGSAPCLAIPVVKGFATVETKVHDAAHDAPRSGTFSIEAGKVAHAWVKVSGDGQPPAGYVTVSWYKTGDCTGTAKTSSSVALVRTIADVATFGQVAPAPGSYSFRAKFLGDLNYESRLGPCVKYTAT